MKNDKQRHVDELFWELHELVLKERDMLERLVRELSLRLTNDRPRGKERHYPEVLPKYRNPKNQSETWCGRGKQPRWLTEELRFGRKLSDFLIHAAAE
jgi:DNA-binding protein H-NS